MTLVLRYSARSDRGLVRQNNQDAVYAGPRLLALADGMGGHAAGEVASSLVISALAPLDDDAPGDDLLAELRHATVEGNAAITRHIADAPDLEGMGTTLTAILFAGSRLGLVHVGDSRAYQLRDGVLTPDHQGRHVRPVADRRGPDHRGGGAHAPAALAAAARHHRAGRRPVADHPGGPARRPLPALLGRAVRRGQRRDAGRHAARLPGPAGVRRPHDRPGAARRRAGQHHLHRGRRRRHRLRRGRPDHGRRRWATAARTRRRRTRPPPGPRRPRSPAPRPAGWRAAAQAPARPSRGSGSSWRWSLLAVLAVLVGGGALTRVWVMQQYFVGFDAEHVVIFQGVRGDVLGLPLHRVTERSDIAVTDLPETERSQVSDGIYASDGLDDARRLVERLRALMLEPCPATPPAPRRSWCPAPGPGPGRGAARRPGRPGPATPGGHHARADGAARAGDDLPAGGLMAATDRARRSPTAPPPLPTGRGVELVLLAFAALLVTGALVLVEANQEQELRPALFYVGAAYLALFTGGALRGAPVRALRRPADPALRRAAQRAGPGDDPPARPGPDRPGHGAGPGAADRAGLPADRLDRGRPGAVRGRARAGPRPPAAGPLRLHRRASPGWSCWPCPACCRRRSPRSTGPGCGCGWASSRSSPASSRRSC